MIRDFAKSAISFSWALSLLGMKQAVNLMRPGQQRGGDLLGPMTQVAVDQLDDSTRGIFRSGDTLQARAVDLAFAWINPATWINPNVWLHPLSNCGQQGASNGQASNRFAQAAAGIGQAFNQAATSFTQAVSQTTAGLAQAVTSSSQRPQNAPGVSVPVAAATPVSNDRATAGWGPMPGDQ
jgi:hypothetical protein